MFDLRLLGGVSLESETGPVSGRVLQRRRLALLAILALTRSRGVSRDRVLGLLWPESDSDSARHSLSDSLYVIRKALGEEAVLAAGDDLRMNAALVRTDVEGFETALEGGDPEAAAAAYTGPLLDGFYIAEAPDFERWVDEERARLKRRYAGALELLAADREAQGDAAGAEEWLRRLSACDPFDSRVTLRLIRALKAAGNPAGALQQARAHSALLREELRVDPPAEVVAEADRLRAELASRDRAPAAAAPAPEVPLPDSALSPGPSPDSGGGENSSSSNLSPRIGGEVASPSEPERGRTAVASPSEPGVRASDSARGGAFSRWRRPVGLAGAGVLLLAALMAIARPEGRPEPALEAASAVSPAAVAVLPFAVRGDEQHAYLREGLVSLLSTKLEGEGAFRSVDPQLVLAATAHDSAATTTPEAARVLARSLGAGLVILGDVVEAGGRLQIAATLYDARSGVRRMTRASIEGAADSLFALVDALAAQLLAGHEQGAASQVTRTAALTTESLAAFKHFLRGEELFRAGQYEQAAEAFQQAVAADSTFALAYVRLAMSQGWAQLADRGAEASRRALQLLDRLPERYRLLLQAAAAREGGNLEEAERLLRLAVERHPDNVEAWNLLGELLFHGNPPRGRSWLAAREPLERAVALDPERYAEPLNHLIQLAAYEGRHAALDSLVTRYLTLHGESELAILIRAIRALALGDRAEAERMARALSELPLGRALFYAGLAAVSWNFPGSLRLTESLLDPSLSPQQQAEVLRQIARIETGRGRWAAADSALARAGQLDSVPSRLFRAELIALRFLPVSRQELEAARDALLRQRSAQDPDGFAWHTFHVGLLSVRLGEWAAASRYAMELERGEDAMGKTGTPWTASLRAHFAWEQGRPAEALALLEVLGPQLPAARDRYLRAELLAAVGRPGEALSWFQSAMEGDPNAIQHAAQAHLRQADIHHQLGNRQEAAEHYARFVELWRDCDPPLRPQVAAAERKLAQLPKPTS